MMLKNILNKFKLREENHKNKVESDDNYCYSQIVWNSKNNLIILISFTQNYFEEIIEIQDAINYTCNLCSKIVYSSYDEELTKDDNSDADLIIHKKYYMLVGGNTKSWQELYMNIHNLGNSVLDRITNEITNNCNSYDFATLINDGVLGEFKYNNEDPKYDTPKVTKNENIIYTDPEVVLNNLPKGFTGRDIIKFIKIYENYKFMTDALINININHIQNIPNALFKNHNLYPLYSALFKDPTPKSLGLLLEPLYKQPDDDSIPGDISDESLDEIFKERYEKFSAVADDNMQYEDIDEELADDEESENMREEDKLNGTDDY